MSDENRDAKRIMDMLTNVMDFQEYADGTRIWWAFMFGNCLEYIADKTFGLNYDIDIGVLYNQCDHEKLTRAFNGIGYRPKITCIHDLDNKPLNMHFEPVEDYIKDTPTIDVYFWYEYKEILYHTYDVNKSGLKRPEEYLLKGVPKEWLIPYSLDIEKERSIGHPERSQMLTAQGTWKFPVFDDACGLTIRLPFKIGTLLDTWYSPSWRFREYYKGQSLSRWQKKIKSFKELR